MKLRIGIITCWYGLYPWYLPYFVHSCSYNPTIDFIIITNNQQPIPNKPINVKIIYKTLDDIKAIASEKLGFPVNIDCPYKLCDFKPAYGFLFSEIVSGYDFWGHGDIDVVYGNIRYFMTNKILKNFDVICVRSEYVTGFFTLYKNAEITNTLFRRSKDYQLVFQSSNCLGFDECNFLCDFLIDGRPIETLQANIESMTHIIKKLNAEGLINAYFDLHVIESTPGQMEWNKGQLIFKKQYEILLYHFISFKIHPLLQIPDWDNIPERFFINEFNLSQ